jgi:hypothetical protein
MSDKELLELAAKAAGIEVAYFHDNFYEKDGKAWGEIIEGSSMKSWMPLHDGKDALMLAVRLGISITPYPIYTQPKHSVIAKQYSMKDSMREKNPTEVVEPYNNDPMAATYRAIVRSAAAGIENSTTP